MFKQLLRDLILIEPIKVEEKTASGIILLNNIKDTKKSALRGRVIQVAPGVKDIKVGDEVRYNDFSTKLVEHEGKDYFLLREEDVISTSRKTETV